VLHHYRAIEAYQAATSLLYGACDASLIAAMDAFKEAVLAAYLAVY
jgi:hypothetical protein